MGDSVTRGGTTELKTSLQGLGHLWTLVGNSCEMGFSLDECGGSLCAACATGLARSERYIGGAGVVQNGI